MPITTKSQLLKCNKSRGTPTTHGGSGRPGQLGQITLPLNFESEVRNCIWRIFFVFSLNKCICHLHQGRVKCVKWFRGTVPIPTANWSRRSPISNFRWTQRNGRGNAIETESALTVDTYSARL